MHIRIHIGLQNFKQDELCRICTCAHAGTYLCNCFKCRCISLIKKVANNIYDNLANVEKANNGMCIRCVRNCKRESIIMLCMQLRAPPSVLLSHYHSVLKNC